MFDLTSLNYLILNIKQSHEQIESYTKILAGDLIKFHAYLINSTTPESYKTNIEILLKVHKKLGKPSFNVKWTQKKLDDDFPVLYEPEFVSNVCEGNVLNDWNLLHDLIVRITSKVYNLNETVIRENDEYAMDIDGNIVDFYFELYDILMTKIKRQTTEKEVISEEAIQTEEEMLYEAELNNIKRQYRIKLEEQNFEISNIIESSSV